MAMTVQDRVKDNMEFLNVVPSLWNTINSLSNPVPALSIFIVIRLLISFISVKKD